MIVNLRPLTFSTFTDLRTENGGDMMSSGPNIVLALALIFRNGDANPAPAPAPAPCNVDTSINVAVGECFSAIE